MICLLIVHVSFILRTVCSWSSTCCSLRVHLFFNVVHLFITTVHVLLSLCSLCSNCCSLGVHWCSLLFTFCSLVLACPCMFRLRSRSGVGPLKAWRSHVLSRPLGHAAPTCIQLGWTFRGHAAPICCVGLKRFMYRLRPTALERCLVRRATQFRPSWGAGGASAAAWHPLLPPALP